jgi:hypothetical protein
MKRLTITFSAALIALSASTPALAKFTLAPKGHSVLAAKGITVTPGEDWNSDSRRPIKKGEVWTLDGSSLNELYFVSGLAAGETIFRDIDKKRRPLPKMAANMGLTDIPDFFESSARIALNTSLFEVSNVSPTKLSGQNGIKFSYRYAVQGAALVRNGVATATLVKGQLYLINFVAPNTYYFERDAPKAEVIMASAKL